MLLPLDCRTAETDELVNGGRRPFISTVDMGGRLCYSVLKILSLYSEFQITKFNRLRINNSAQVEQNFKYRLLTNLDRSRYCILSSGSFSSINYIC